MGNLTVGYDREFGSDGEAFVVPFLAAGVTGNQALDYPPATYCTAGGEGFSLAV